MRVLTVLACFGTEQYPHAEQELDEIFRRRMPELDRTILVVDNALPTTVVQHQTARMLIGGDNGAYEFSAFDRAVQFIGSEIWRYDLVHFATSAFNTLHVEYLEHLEIPLLEAAANQPACVGHIDCYNEAVEILGFRTQHWVRSCCFFLPPAEVKALGSFVTIRDGSRFFSHDPEAPFCADAPLSHRYRKYIIDWLTGGDIGQGVRWHSKLELRHQTLPSFERKAVAIMNEQMLGVRLRAMGCRMIDVTWLAAMLAGKDVSSILWATIWREQLAGRNRYAVVLPAPAHARVLNRSC